jgi:sugar (pentulose or hexulose) kinase
MTAPSAAWTPWPRTATSFETAIRTGSFLVNWMVERLFNLSPAKNPAIFKTLEAEAKASPVGANGLVLVPYWSGVMTPYWDSSARGVIAGLSGNHNRGDVYRALLEGVALEQAMMTNLRSPPDEPHRPLCRDRWAGARAPTSGARSWRMPRPAR